MEGSTGDGDYRRVRSPSRPPPPQRMQHQTTLESDLHSADDEFPLGHHDDDDEFDDDDTGSDRLSPVVAMRSQRRISNAAIGVDTLQTIEYGTTVGTTAGRTRKGSHGAMLYTGPRRTSETVRSSAMNEPSVTQHETGVTITATMGHESPAYLATTGGSPSFQKKQLAEKSYVHGSYRMNSYFAIRLLRIMQLLVVIDILALVSFYGLTQGDVTKDGALYVASPIAAIFSRGDPCGTTISMAALVYHLLPAVVILGLPASGFSIFEPFKREDRVGRGGRIQKVKRTIYLQVCEMTAVLLFLLTGLMAVVAAYHLVVGELFTCTTNYSVYIFGVVAVLVYGLIYVEIRYFMRFREHLKMQLGAFSEADQTGDVKAHMLRNKQRRKRIQEELARAARADKTGEPRPPQPPARSQIVEFVRKRLYRGAQLGDIRLLKRTLRVAKNHLGSGFAKDCYPDPQIRFWFHATSTKNPMHVAAYHGNIPAMELLFRAKFAVNSFDKISRFRFSTGDIFWYMARAFIRQPVMSAEDSYGASAIFKSTLVTPLHCAVSTGRVDAVNWLIAHGADVNLCSRSSFRHESKLPPIFLADHPDIAKELLAAGANHLVIPDPGHMNTITVLQMAYLRGNYAVAQMLENWGGDVALTPLHAAAAMNDTARIRHLLRKKVNPDCLGELGYVGLNKRTPLHWASVNGAIDAIELLLGAKANADAQDTRGRTPLHWAARVGQVEAVKVLLAAGADPNIVDEGGMTPILCAACAGGTTAEMFKMMVRHGAKINHQLPSTGDTALHIAVKLDDLPTAVALLSVGGDIMRMNHQGLRPIDCTTSTRLQFELKRAAGNRDVMISYTHTHKEFALKLRKTLEDANITTWLDLMDPSGIGGGAVWREEIARGVTNAAVVVCILTEDYAQSPWCMKELALAKQVGTPILAISTENAKISEELQVYLYTRQIIPFEPSITTVERVGERNIQYTYNDDAYRQQARLLLDGLRDEIEKRKEQVLRKNLTRAATASTASASYHNLTALNSTFQGGAPASRTRGMWRQGSAQTVGGVAPYSNSAVQFDERAPEALQQVRIMNEDTTRDGYMYTMCTGQFDVGLHDTNHAAPKHNGRDFFDSNESMLSSVNSFTGGGGLDEPTYRELGLNDLSKSIILNQSGYYVHNPKAGHGGTGDATSPPSTRGHKMSLNNGTVLETFKDVKDIVDDGQQFVFICHADSHTTFVRRLCAALCREGGLHCYVDRRHGQKGSRSQNSPPRSPLLPPDATNEEEGEEDDMIGRIHDAKDAILKCSAFIVVVSDKTLSSHLVKDQLAFAEDKGKKIIPVVANPLEFSLDMQYSLARSDFYHFFTSGDMIGFEKSLDQVLATLREEIYGISVEPAETSRIPKSFNPSQMSSLSVRDSGVPTTFGLGRDRDRDPTLRRRLLSNNSLLGGGDTGSAVSGHSSGWIEPTSTRRGNLSFVSTDGDGGVPSTASARPLNSDMSLQQAMLGTFSTLMRRITDELDDEDDEDAENLILDDDDLMDDELDVPDVNLLRSVSDQSAHSASGNNYPGTGEPPIGPFGMRPVYQARPGRLSAILSTSNASVSILERGSDEEARSIDNVKLKIEKSPGFLPKSPAYHPRSPAPRPKSPAPRPK